MRGQWLLWPIYQPVITLPCDRWAAIAALRAAEAAARRTVLLTAAFTFILVLVGLGVLAAAAPGAWGPVPAGFGAVFTLVALVFILVLALFPVMVYMRVSPWLSYLEELRRGLEEGRIRVEDVCGKPLTLGPG